MNMFERYLETLCYRRSDSKQRVDFRRAFAQLGLPLIVAFILALIGVEVDEGSNAISFISIIAGLMCTSVRGKNVHHEARQDNRRK